MINNSKIVKFEGVGEILFEQSSIAKHVRISFRPPSYIRVAVPNGVTFSEAKKFAEIKSAWIKKQIKRFSSSKTVSLYNKFSEMSLKDIEIESDIITKRVIVLAKKNGFKHGKISVKKMKTRWGSCSYKNNIVKCIHMFYQYQEIQFASLEKCEFSKTTLYSALCKKISYFFVKLSECFLDFELQ